MRQGLTIFGGLMVLLTAGVLGFGYWPVYEVVYGALVAMAAMIAATFLWLYLRRATPLALGMAFSWTGCAATVGWFWSARLLGHPAAMAEHPALFAFLALYLTGAGLHFAVIEASLGLRRNAGLMAMAGALLVSLLVIAIF